MSTETGQLPVSGEQYRALMTASEAYFGACFDLVESKAKVHVEHALSRDHCGGFSLVVIPKVELQRKIRFLHRQYVMRCDRVHMIKDDAGTLFALISLDEGEVQDVTVNDPGQACTHAVCIFPGSGASPRFYLLPPNCF